MTKPKRLWTCTDHEGYWPVGTASIVMANSEEEAKKLLADALATKGLGVTGFTLQEVDCKQPFALVIRDGDY